MFNVVIKDPNMVSACGRSLLLKAETNYQLFQNFMTFKISEASKTKQSHRGQNVYYKKI